MSIKTIRTCDKCGLAVEREGNDQPSDVVQSFHHVNLSFELCKHCESLYGELLETIRVDGRGTIQRFLENLT